jgi:hypothetical protein
MSTGTTIIKRALQRIGASSALSEPSPETVQTAFGILNSMLSMWLSQNIHTGVTLLNVPGDELNEKQDCTNAIIDNLAVHLGPDFDNGKGVVSQDLRGLARSQFSMVKSLYQTFDIPKKVVSSTLPRGQGNTRFSRDSAFYSEGDKIGN